MKGRYWTATFGTFEHKLADSDGANVVNMLWYYSIHKIGENIHIVGETA